ncbi:MAG: hypothetical protein ACRDZ5_04245, partial [Acidimicrobiales bacterium]
MWDEIDLVNNTSVRVTLTDFHEFGDSLFFSDDSLFFTLRVRAPQDDVAVQAESDGGEVEVEHRSPGPASPGTLELGVRFSDGRAGDNLYSNGTFTSDDGVLLAVTGGGGEYGAGRGVVFDVKWELCPTPPVGPT